MYAKTRKFDSKSLLVICLLLCLVSQKGFAQSTIDTALFKMNTSAFSEKVGNFLGSINKRFQKKTSNLLNKCEKQERKIYKSLLNTSDSLLARSRLSSIALEYDSLHSQLRSDSSIRVRVYNPALDSMRIALIISNPSDNNIQRANELQSSFDKSLSVQKFINARRERIKSELRNSNAIRSLHQIDKRAYYYQQQISDYKLMGGSFLQLPTRNKSRSSKWLPLQYPEWKCKSGKVKRQYRIFKSGLRGRAWHFIEGYVR